MHRVFITLCFFGSLCWSAHAHDLTHAHYLANEGVMVERGDTKILFDPLPLSGFGTYPELPAKMKADLMQGAPPYDGIDIVFISHAHRDHFSSADMIAYLLARPEVHLVAPQQALEMMEADDTWTDALRTRITSISLEFGDAPLQHRHGQIRANIVRIPHSGWPTSRLDIENMLYQVTLEDTHTVIHMGDADARAQHFTPYQALWEATVTDMAFPPYWFALVPGAYAFLQETMNVREIVGIHVPIEVPDDLINSETDYFSKPGETRDIIKPQSNGPNGN